MSKCHFGVKQVDFLGRTITPADEAPQTDKVKDFLSKLRFPKSKKALQRYIGFLNFYRNYIPRLSERLSPFFKLLKETSKFYIPTNLVEDFTNLNKLLENSCQLALRQPLNDKQLIVMSDASFTAAGYAIMIEDDPNQNFSPNVKHMHQLHLALKQLFHYKRNCPYMQKNFFLFTLLSLSLDTSCGVALSQS